MKKILALALFGSLVLGGCARQEPAVGRQEGIEAPDFTLKNIEGADVTLSSFKGVSPVLIVFWATWCPYCREEMPNLVKLKEKYGPALEIMAIDIQESQKQVASFVQAHRLNFTVLLDEEGAVAADYGLAGVPTMVLVDKEGKGVFADNRLSSEMLRLIAKLVV